MVEASGLARRERNADALGRTGLGIYSAVAWVTRLKEMLPLMGFGRVVAL